MELVCWCAGVTSKTAVSNGRSCRNNHTGCSSLAQSEGFLCTQNPNSIVSSRRPFTTQSTRPNHTHITINSPVRQKQKHVGCYSEKMLCAPHQSSSLQRRCLSYTDLTHGHWPADEPSCEHRVPRFAPIFLPYCRLTHDALLRRPTQP